MSDKVQVNRTLTGIVISDKGDKTVTVKVERKEKHKTFKKYVKKQKKYMAHDKDNSCNIGDKVLIKETRPLSKMKRWVVLEVLEKKKI